MTIGLLIESLTIDSLSILKVKQTRKAIRYSLYNSSIKNSKGTYE